MSDRPFWRKLQRFPREYPGFLEGVATLFTVALFIATYLLQSRVDTSEAGARVVFLVGAVALCGMVSYGAMVRHYIPFISHLIVVGACSICLSQLTALLSKLPGFQEAPIIGPEGWGYLIHHDDMLLYPGFILMLCGFYLSILHAARMRQDIIREAGEKELALRTSEESAAYLARRIEFENLATGVSTRFINLSPVEIDAEITRSLGELTRFTGVDRAYIVFSQAGTFSVKEAFECCVSGAPSFKADLANASVEEFQWTLGVLGAGECVRVQRLEDLPAEAAFEVAWFEGQGIQSLIIVPIISNHILRGYIGFDTVGREIDWDDETQPLLRMIGEIFLSAWDRRCGEQLRNALELQVQQAQKLESLGVMAGGIAHDFNNLLTGIMGNTELAQLEVGPDSEIYRYLEGVIRSSRRAAELCRQMLAYAGRGKFVTQPINLKELIADTMALLRASSSSRTEFVLDLAENLPEVQGDLGQFRQVIGNLVTNASEALDEQAGTVTIRTDRRVCDVDFLRDTYLAEPLAPGDYILFEVSDTGCGISEEVKDRIFEPFYTTRFAGRGLGLPAVLGIVRSHKGAIRIVSEVGQGTSVQLYFPVNTTLSSTWLVAGESQGDWHGRGTVLLADDEEMVLSVGTMMLRHLGLDVLAAATSDEAVDRASAHSESIQCVILDYDMPGSDCDITYERLRERLPNVPIVIASGHLQQDIESRLKSDIDVAFLSKPFELAGLERLLQSVLTTGTSGGSQQG